MSAPQNQISGKAVSSPKLRENTCPASNAFFGNVRLRTNGSSAVCPCSPTRAIRTAASVPEPAQEPACEKLGARHARTRRHTLAVSSFHFDQHPLSSTAATHKLASRLVFGAEPLSCTQRGLLRCDRSRGFAHTHATAHRRESNTLAASR